MIFNSANEPIPYVISLLRLLAHTSLATMAPLLLVVKPADKCARQSVSINFRISLQSRCTMERLSPKLLVNILNHC